MLCAELCVQGKVTGKSSSHSYGQLEATWGSLAYATVYSYVSVVRGTVCHEVPHRQFVFTIPRVLRGIFRKRRDLLHLLFQTATDTLPKTQDGKTQDTRQEFVFFKVGLQRRSVIVEANDSRKALFVLCLAVLCLRRRRPEPIPARSQ